MRWSNSMYDFPHVSHVNGSTLAVYDCPRVSHVIGSTPARHCVLSCFLSVLERANDFPHVLHLKCLTPVCVLSCTLRVLDCINDFPHVSHVTRFSPVCIRLCALRDPKCAHDFLHESYAKGLTHRMRSFVHFQRFRVYK